MSEKTFWFEITSNCNIGTVVSAFDKEPGEEGYEFREDHLIEDETFVTPEEAMEIDCQLPSDGYYKIYIINEYPSYYSVFNKDISSDLDCEKIYLKIFSQIHDCLPNKNITNINYDNNINIEKVEVTPDIEEMENIIYDNELLKTIGDEIEGFYILFIVDSLGNPKLCKVI
jgi:hypothetical protein